MRPILDMTVTITKMLRAYLLCETRTYRVQHVFVMRKNQKFATAFKQVQNIVPETSSPENTVFSMRIFAAVGRVVQHTDEITNKLCI